MKTLDAPFTEAKVRQLVVGDLVSLSGTIYTARDRVHRHLNDGGILPVDLKDGAIYHCGPLVIRRDQSWAVRAAGPTTSMRAEPYMAGIIRKHGVRVVIGKGGMGESTRKACQEAGCVYLDAVGGAGCVAAACVESVGAVHFMEEFGAAEAMWELSVRGLVCVVGIDSAGHSLHADVLASSAARLQDLFCLA
ncbi:MAG: hypothetical protein FJ224_09760 [Lentisphaerae bacterium]|nr:hypothetical protein [Lentisphaerota bacterium]